MQQHEGEVAEQQAADDPPAQAAAQLWQHRFEHSGAQGQHQRQAHHQIGEVEALLRQGLQDLAEVAALGAIFEQQTNAQLIAAIKRIIRGAQGAVEIQGAAVIAAHLTLIHRLTELVDPLPLVVEQLHSHLVPRLQRPSQLPLAPYHQIEAAAVAFIEQGVAGEGGQRIVGGAQHQRLGTAQPATGIDQRQQQGQQQQSAQ